MEMTRVPFVVELHDSSQVGEARRAVHTMAKALEVDQERESRAAIVVTELATNILKHARTGEIVLQQVAGHADRGIQVLGIDKGTGIQDIPRALTDGWSSAGTLGGGLGSMRRLADKFDLYSSPSGTVVFCEFCNRRERPAEADELTIGVVSVPYPGETVNGDGWIARVSGDKIVLMVADGLGHGPLAAAASQEAARVVLDDRADAPGLLLEDCHHALAKTRGAAISIAAIDVRSGILQYAGVGNVTGSISSPDSSRGLGTHNGTVGHVMSKPQEFGYPWSQNSILVIHSDGISARWNLDAYPGIRNKHPLVIAAIIHRDFRRTLDDSTVLVAYNRAA